MINLLSSISIDFIIVLIFLAINLVVGFHKGRGVKNISDFALGGRNFSTFTLVATLVAILATGSSFTITLCRTYSQGINYVIASSGIALSFFIIGYVFVPRMSKFLGDISVADTMGKLYGDKVKLITAIAGSIGATGIIAVQFKVFAVMINLFMNLSGGTQISEEGSIFLAAGIVTFYSAFGGIKSVNFTDVVQSISFLIIIPIIGFIVYKHFISTGNSFIDGFSYSKFDLAKVFNYKNHDFWSLIALATYFLIPGIEPPIFQRIAIGRNVFQVKKAFIIAGICLLFIKLTLSLIGFFILHINPNLESSQILPYVIDNYSFIGIKALIIISITSMAMSTADSYINSSAVLISNDILSVLFNIKTEKNKFLLAITSSIVLGLGGIYFATSASDLLTIILFANSFYMPIVTTPLMITILGFRTKTKTILIGMAAGAVTVIIWKYILKISADVIVFAMGINFIFIMASHYLLKLEGGWNAVETPDEVIMIKEQRARDWKKVKEYIKGFSYAKFCKKYSLKNEMNYITFGIVSFFVIMATLFSMPVKMQLLQFDGLKILLVVSLTTSAIFSGFYLWPKKIRKLEYIDRIFPLGALILLPFTGSLFVIASDFYTTQLMIFILDMVILSFLMRWKPAILISIFGIYLANKVAPLLFNTYNYTNNIDSIYVVLLLSVFVIRFFIGPKEEKDAINEFIIKYLKKRHEEETLEIVKLRDHRGEYIKRIEDEAIMIWAQSYKKLESLKKEIPLDSIKTKKQLDSFLEKLSPLVSKFNDGVDYFKSVFKQLETQVEINLSDYNIKEVTLETIEEYKKHSDTVPNIINFINRIHYEKLTFDKELIKKAIKDLLINISKISEEKIDVILETDVISYDLDFTTDLKMKKDAIKISFKCKKDEEILDDFLKEHANLYDIYNIIDAHYGEVNENSQSNLLHYSYLIPTDLSEIRPKPMDIRNLIIKKLNRDTEEIVKGKSMIEKQELAKKMKEEGIKISIISKLLLLDVKKI